MQTNHIDYSERHFDRGTRYGVAATLSQSGASAWLFRATYDTAVAKPYKGPTKLWLRLARLKLQLRLFAYRVFGYKGQPYTKWRVSPTE